MKEGLIGGSSLTRVERLEMDGPKALPKLCRVSDVAQACGLSRTTIYKLMKSGDIKATQTGRAWRVDRDSVLSYFGI